MLKIAMSTAASSLLRALIGRARVPRDRILLTEMQSTDWQSLTLTGERHVFALRVSAAHSDAIVERMCAGLEDAEFSIPGLIVADIAVMEGPCREKDGSTRVTIEALTIEE
jgi:hypothetical protein